MLPLFPGCCLIGERIAPPRVTKNKRATEAARPAHRNLAPVKRSIPLRLPRRPRLETFVRPEVLLGHFAHALLDEGVHAAGIGGIVAAREIFPDRMADELVSR